ncbi:hypothetical protein FRC11_013552 [Ceratobasidium sp. 423]|nr:hypothetical protein FRC11_013552 [Ceratobasidium sp. 423]
MGYWALNKVNVVKQMALYIQCLEAVVMHVAYLDEKGKEVLGGIANTQQEFDGGMAEFEALEDDEWDTWYDEEEEDIELEEA